MAGSFYDGPFWPLFERDEDPEGSPAHRQSLVNRANLEARQLFAHMENYVFSYADDAYFGGVLSKENFTALGDAANTFANVVHQCTREIRGDEEQ